MTSRFEYRIREVHTGNIIGFLEDDEKHAIEFAESFAKANPMKKYQLLKVVARCRKEDISWERKNGFIYSVIER